MRKCLLLAIVLVVALQACINFRTEYPKIQYYSLEQLPFTFRSIASLNVLIAFKDFRVPAELETNSLMTKWKDGRVQKYYYFRWSSDYSEMISDFLVKRFNLSGGFSKPVVYASSMVIPDYYLDCQVIDFSAYSDDEDAKGNFVQVSLHISLEQRLPMSVGNNIVLSRLYTQKIERGNKFAESIPPAFSKALSLIVDKIILDVQSTIAQEGKE
jgi:ABC-type uncharacterized transport system auxiliary subunit